MKTGVLNGMNAKTIKTEKNMGFHLRKFWKSLMILHLLKALTENIPELRTGTMVLDALTASSI